MTKFMRSFDTKRLIEEGKAAPDGVVGALFKGWALPGEACADKKMLRVCVRGGYLNLYAKGQCVAKVSVGARKGVVVETHNAYYQGLKKGHGGKKPTGYARITAEEMRNGSLVAGWVETALTYAGAEKRFVDDLVAANANIIDLEMGLPADASADGGKVAPRMDVVAVQAADGAVSLAFWEAKCANNGELRARGTPDVFGQLQKYVTWMTDKRQEEVQEAYQQATRVLLALQQHFRPDANEGACAEVWSKLVAAKKPQVVLQPGVVVGCYPPEGCGPNAAKRILAMLQSFGGTHQQKLAAKQTVRMVDSAERTACRLDTLPAAA